MQIQYEKLFALHLKHGYFLDGNGPAVSIIPTRHTEQLMKELGIRLVERNYGMEVFYDNNPQKLVAENLINLSFILRPTDPLFLNYSDLPLALSNNPIRYLTNLSSDNSEDIVVKDLKSYATRPQEFNIKATSQDAQISLTDELGDEIATYAGSSDDTDASSMLSAAVGDSGEIRVNLHGEPAGLYTLMEGEEVLEHFILAPQAWQAGDVGLLSVLLGNTGNKGKHILADGVVTPASFSLKFTPRKTKWRYSLIDSGNTGYTNFQLLDAASKQPLGPSAYSQDTKQLPDGSTAVVLTTEATIPLQQRPGSHFMLSMKPSNGKLITINLPSADANHISVDELSTTDTSSPPTFYSDLYVYL